MDAFDILSRSSGGGIDIHLLPLTGHVVFIVPLTGHSVRTLVDIVGYHTAVVLEVFNDKTGFFSLEAGSGPCLEAWPTPSHMLHTSSSSGVPPTNPPPRNLGGPHDVRHVPDEEHQDKEEEDAYGPLLEASFPKECASQKVESP